MDKRSIFKLMRVLFSREERIGLIRVQIWAVLGGILAGIGFYLFLFAAAALISNTPQLGLDFISWLVVIAVCAALSSVCMFLRNMRTYPKCLSIMEGMFERLGDKIARLPIGVLQGQDAGHFSRLVTQELMNLTESVAHFVGELVHGITTLVTLMLISFWYNLPVGIFFLITVPVSLLVNRLGIWINTRMANTIEATERDCASRIVEFARCQQALRACHRSTDLPMLQESMGACRKARNRGLLFETIGLIVQGFAVQNIPFSMAFFVVYLFGTGQVNALEAFLLVGLSLRLYLVFNDIVVGVVGISSSTGFLRSFSGVLTRPDLVQPVVSEPFTQPGELVFDHVSFAYTPEKPVLRDVSFRVAPHKLVAIVGPSGCGKTTLARLAARFWDVDAGRVCVSGVPVEMLTTRDLMSQLSIVFQDVYLFDQPLIENIRLGRSDASDEEVKRAAHLAGVDEIAERQGWDVSVGEGGRALSGGERQRVSIARAILKQAPIVLFDEATSALDAENEGNIVACMEELRRTSTLVVIAHKLETIMAADQIVVLTSQGSIAQMGTHAELVDQDGPYHDFWMARTEAAGWQLV